MFTQSTNEKEKIMSAWLCSDEHIFEMAKYFANNCQRWANNRMTFKEVAELLYNANVESLGARYGDDVYPPIKVPENYSPVVSNIFHMAKLVGCYEYQSCEHNGWATSTAKDICDAISNNLITEHPDYEAAPWGFERAAYITEFVNKS